MSELTLESLARRVEALENAVAVLGAQRSPKDWLGSFTDFTQLTCGFLADLE